MRKLALGLLIIWVFGFMGLMTVQTNIVHADNTIVLGNNSYTAPTISDDYSYYTLQYYDAPYPNTYFIQGTIFTAGVETTIYSLHARVGASIPEMSFSMAIYYYLGGDSWILLDNTESQMLGSGGEDFGWNGIKIKDLTWNIPSGLDIHNGVSYLLAVKLDNFINENGFAIGCLSESSDTPSFSYTDSFGGGNIQTWSNPFPEETPYALSYYTLWAEVQTYPNPPTDLLTSGRTNPTDLQTWEPTFSAIDTESIISIKSFDYYAIQISTSPTFDTLWWDWGQTTLPSTFESGERSPELPYNGQNLSENTTYYWRIKFWNDRGLESEWSEPATFRISFPNPNITGRLLPPAAVIMAGLICFFLDLAYLYFKVASIHDLLSGAEGLTGVIYFFLAAVIIWGVVIALIA